MRQPPRATITFQQPHGRKVVVYRRMPYRWLFTRRGLANLRAWSSMSNTVRGVCVAFDVPPSLVE